MPAVVAELTTGQLQAQALEVPEAAAQVLAPELE
jgi:hypothetical protein